MLHVENRLEGSGLVPELILVGICLGQLASGWIDEILQRLMKTEKKGSPLLHSQSKTESGLLCASPAEGVNMLARYVT